MKFFVAAAVLAFAATARAQNLLETLVSLNQTATFNLTQLIGLATPFPAVVSILNGTAPYTVFAPTDAAVTRFIGSLNGAAPTQDQILSILTYHVSPGTYPGSTVVPFSVLKTALAAPGLGDGQTQNLIARQNATGVTLQHGAGTANVITSRTATNGVLHVIDTLLVPPTDAATTATAAGLTSLVDTVRAANLATAITSAKNITIFAPVNAAFTAIADVVRTLSTSQVAGVLQYHVVPSVVFSSAVVSLPNNTQVGTLLGQNITIIQNGTSGPYLLGVGNSGPVRLVATDVLIANGVVHVIDTVLIPNVTAIPNTPSSTNATANGTSTASPTPTRSGAMTTMVSSFAALVVFCVAFLLL